MSYGFPEGSSQQFSQTFAAAKTITAMTNANPAVCTSVAHGYTTGDEVLITSTWEDATDTVFKVTVLTADTFSLSGLNALIPASIRLAALVRHRRSAVGRQSPRC
jgi:hypothetical protein